MSYPYMDMPLKIGSDRYYAKKLGISSSKANSLGKAECQRRLEEKEAIKKIVYIENPEEKIKDKLNEKFEDLLDKKILEETEKIIESFKNGIKIEDFIDETIKKITVASLLYCQKYSLGLITGSKKNTERIRFTLNILKLIPSPLLNNSPLTQRKMNKISKEKNLKKLID